LRTRPCALGRLPGVLGAAAQWVVLAVAATGCVGRIHSIAPDYLGAIPRDSVARWAAPFRPTVHLQYDLRWRFENARGKAAGRGVARFAPPDTLRFDYRGPFGRSGSALIVGQGPVWSEPEGDVNDLIPVAPILWAALGIVVPLDDADTVLGGKTATEEAWRYRRGEEALDYVHIRTASPRLLAERRTGGRILGNVDVALAGDADGDRVAIMRFPRDRATFELTIRRVDTVAAFPPETWRRP
jgi:hypothetical protein